MSSYWNTRSSSNRDNDLEEYFDGCCGLSRTQRMYAFGGCFAIGFLISLLSTLLLSTGQITSYAILYSFGNVVAISSTMFLSGPVTHLKRMFDSTRWIATTVFLVTLGLTLFVAFTLADGAGKIILCLILCVLQMLAGIWYSLSYIPFARQAVVGCFKGLTG